jgi:hypothetical protein
LFCPEKSLLTLQAQTEVLVDARQLKIRTGSLGTPKPVSSCFLPPVDRTTLASQQHYGASRSGAKPERCAVAVTAGSSAESCPCGTPAESDDRCAPGVAVFEKYNLKPGRPVQSWPNFDPTRLDPRRLLIWKMSAS